MSPDDQLPFPPILTGREIRARAQEEPQGWLLDRIIALTGTTLIVGKAGDGKTRWLAHLTVSIAAGLPQAGRDVKQGLVLWIYLEHPWSDIESYLRASAIGMGLSDWVDLPIMAIDRDHPLRLNIYNVPQMEALAQWCDENNVAVVVIDSARATGQHEELDSNDARQMLEHANILSSKRKRPIVIITHPPKSGGATRGSGDWAGGSESQVLFSTEEENVAVITMKTLPHGAGRRETIGLTAHHSEDGVLTYEDRPLEDEDGEAKRPKGKPTKAKVDVRLVQEVRKRQGQSISQLVELLEARKPDVSDAVKRLSGPNGPLKTSPGPRGAILVSLSHPLVLAQN